jgi:hypothetical protein
VGSLKDTSVGVDVAEARKGLDLVALNGAREIVESQARLTVSEAIRIVKSLAPSVVCIDSPSGWSLSGKSRLAERQLATIGIQSYRTGPDPGHHPFYAWIRVGLEIYEGLSDLYPVYRGGEVVGHAAEIFPHATAALLAGELPLSSGDKVEFRRQVLRERGIAEGQLPTPDQVDAALGALTGLIALVDGHDSVGDPDEGVILLPVPDVPQARLRRRGLPSRAPSRAAPARPSPSPQRPGLTVQIGYENRNGQTVVAPTGLPGTDHRQSVYVLRCRRCGAEYGCNGSDNFQRKCPRCQGGAPGLAYS